MHAFTYYRLTYTTHSRAKPLKAIYQHIHYCCRIWASKQANNCSPFSKAQAISATAWASNRFIGSESPVWSTHMTNASSVNGGAIIFCAIMVFVLFHGSFSSPRGSSSIRARRLQMNSEVTIPEKLFWRPNELGVQHYTLLGDSIYLFIYSPSHFQTLPVNCQFAALISCSHYLSPWCSCLKPVDVLLDL